MTKIKLNTSEISEGRPKRVEIGGEGVLVARQGGEFYAIGDECTHMGCSLSEGTLEGTVITCPCHGTKFDVTNGKVVVWVGKYPVLGRLTSFMKKDEPVYKVIVEGDEITIRD